MGAWGTGIFDDDTTCDVRDDFIDYLEEYLAEFNVDDDLEVMSLVYIGLSAIQLDKKCLQEQVRKNAIELIERGADLELWEEADENDYEERKKVLSEFKQMLL